MVICDCWSAFFVPCSSGKSSGGKQKVLRWKLSWLSCGLILEKYNGKMIMKKSKEKLVTSNWMSTASTWRSRHSLNQRWETKLTAWSRRPSLSTASTVFQGKLGVRRQTRTQLLMKKLQVWCGPISMYFTSIILLLVRVAQTILLLLWLHVKETPPRLWEATMSWKIRKTRCKQGYLLDQ